MIKSQFKMIKYEAHLAEVEIMMTVLWLVGLFPKQRKNTLWTFPSGRFSLHQQLSVSKSYHSGSLESDLQDPEQNWKERLWNDSHVLIWERTRLGDIVILLNKNIY